MRGKNQDSTRREQDGTLREVSRTGSDEERGREYRGRESYEEQYPGGRGGLSDIHERPRYPSDQYAQGRERDERDWEREWERDSFSADDFDRSAPNRGGYGGFDESAQDRGYRRHRDSWPSSAGRRPGSGRLRYGGPFNAGERERYPWGAEPRGTFGGDRSYGSRSDRMPEWSESGERFEQGGMSLDDGRFVTRSRAWGGGARARNDNWPKGYKRSDERIREDVCDRLCSRWDVEAREIEVNVANGEVTLSGSVPDRAMKLRAESVSDQVSGVREVHNQLRVIPRSGSAQ